MIDFGRHLKNLRTKNSVTQKELAEYIGVSERGIQNYELNSRKPNFEILIKLADFFNVSIDYLVGRTDNPEIKR